MQDRREHPGWHGLAIRGFLEDSSALFGVLAEIEALGLEFARAPSDPDGTEITVMR